MEMYEANYLRFRRLCPEIYDVGHRALSSTLDGPDLHLRVLARTHYTSSVHLSYLMKDPYGIVHSNPDLNLRVYYDARQAEVLSCSHGCLRHGVGTQTGGLAHDLTYKWAMNRFLYKWLSYCLGQGHSFSSTPARKASRTHLPRVLG
jgi:uncharacterized protein YqiB (DUF1249 family)